MTAPKVPHGMTEVYQIFGDIRRYIRSDGTLDPAWEEVHISRIPLPAPLRYEGIMLTHITCHKLLCDVMEDVLRDLVQRQLWAKLREYGGGFEFRKKRGMNVISLHSLGIAWDFDPSNNQLGTMGTMDHGVVMTFQSRGFEWGGDFIGRKDPMHFQYATGC